MTFAVYRLVDNEPVGVVTASSIGHAHAKAAERFADEGLCRLEEVDLRDLIAQWHQDGKAVLRDR